MIEQNHTTEESVIETVLRHFPAVQGIYLFGSYGNETQWPQSDIDIAVLLPHELARRQGGLVLNPCRFELARQLRRQVDLVNAREVSTVFQKEIIHGRLICCRDRYAVDEFEMLVMSLYQRLNEERAEILESFFKSGKAYAI